MCVGAARWMRNKTGGRDGELADDLLAHSQVKLWNASSICVLVWKRFASIPDHNQP